MTLSILAPCAQLLVQNGQLWVKMGDGQSELSGCSGGMWRPPFHLLICSTWEERWGIEKYVRMGKWAKMSYTCKDRYWFSLHSVPRLNIQTEEMTRIEGTTWGIWPPQVVGSHNCGDEVCQSAPCESWWWLGRAHVDPPPEPAKMQ